MKFEKASLKIWEKVVKNSPNSTFFHSPEWYSICKKMHYFRTIETLCFEQNKEKCVLPLCSKGWSIINSKRYISSPLGTYGGLVYSHNISDKVHNRFKQKIRSLKNVMIHGNPFSSPIPNQEGPLFTQVINLKLLDFNNLLTGWTSKHKASLLKANSNNLEFFEANQAEEWNQYFRIYNENVKLRGSSSSNNYNLKFFRLIFGLDKKYRTLFLIKEKGEIISGGIFFTYGGRVHYWHGASTIKGKEKCASFLLIYEAIKNTSFFGLDTFDFLPSGGVHGVVHFKKGFGSNIRHFNKVSFN